MLRLLDILLSSVGLLLASPVMAVIGCLTLVETGSPLFRQERVGRRRRPFVLLKFRTMRRDTPSVATHQVDPAAVTTRGRFLRASKLDELPQLWNVLRGDMSLVGPRPCLPVQAEVIRAREARDVFDARPGITGLSQICGIDMSSPELLADTDARMLRRLNVRNYLGYILQTIVGRGVGDRLRRS